MRFPCKAGLALLRSYVSGERGRALRVQLAARHPECSDEEIEDAVQGTCQCFLDEADDISDPGKAYVWLRTEAHRILGHDAERQHRDGVWPRDLLWLFLRFEVASPISLRDILAPPAVNRFILEL